MNALLRKFRRYFLHTQDIEDVVIEYCSAIKIDIPLSILEYSIFQHPNYPSIYSIYDVLKQFGVEGCALKVKDNKELKILPTPFIAHVKGETSNTFVLVYEITDSYVDAYISGKRRKVSREYFLTLFNGYTLVFDNSNKINGELKDSYAEEKAKENLKWGLYLGIFFLLPIFLFINCIHMALACSFNWQDLLFLLGYLLGSLLSFILILYDTNSIHGKIKKICSMGKHTSCSDVLSTKGALFLGVHWSIWGFSYFVSMFVCYTFNIYSGVPQIPLLVINIVASSYIFYSIYYQFAIIKKLCPICLMVQVMLLFLSVMSILFFYKTSFQTYIQTGIEFSIIFLVIFLLTFTLFEISNNRLSIKQLRRSLSILKFNPVLFNILLQDQKKIDQLPMNLGVILGNPKGSIQIIKVCNPYCPSCIKSHVAILTDF